MAEETPLMQDFVTPGQIKARRDIAEALMKQPIYVGESGNVKAVSPFGGLAQMTGALMGGRMLNSAGEAERASHLGYVHSLEEAPGTIGSVDGPRADAGEHGPLAYATSAQESGGDYHALGKVITKGSLVGDRAYGKYQVMGTNIPKWTQEVLGRPMSPAEFLNSPEAQEAVYKVKFGQLVRQFGPEGAARAWLGGPGGVNHPGRADQNGMTIGQYGRDFMQLASNAAGVPATADAAQTSPQDGQALAFSGEPTGAPPEAPGSPAAMSSTLAGETKVAAGRRGAAPVIPGGVRPAPGGGITPGTIPLRSTMSRAQYERAMASALANGDDAMVAHLQDVYLSQNQPQMVKDSLGRDVVVGRDGSQMLINTPFPVTSDIDGIKTTRYYQYQIGPDGRPYMQKIPKSKAGGPAAATPAPATTEEPVPSLKFAPEDKGAAAEEAPAEITKGPEAAAAERGGMLATKPPGSTALPFAETHLPNTPTGTTSGVETPDLDEMEPAEQAEWKRQFNINQKAAEQFNTADTAEVIKSNKATQDVVRTATQSRDYIALAKKMLADPRLQSMTGPGANLKYDWKSLLAFLGNQDAEAQRGLVDTFKKITSSGIIGTLKSDYGGLGQIRNKEIELSEKATISPTNTVAANQAVLDIADRVIQRHQMVGKLLNMYIKGQRWDKDGDPIKGKTTEKPTFAGMSEMVNKYLENHPLYDDKEKDASGKTKLDRILDLFKGSEKTEKKKSKTLPAGSKPDEEVSAPAPTASPRKVIPHDELPPGGSYH